MSVRTFERIIKFYSPRESGNLETATIVAWGSASKSSESTTRSQFRNLGRGRPLTSNGAPCEIKQESKSTDQR